MIDHCIENDIKFNEEISNKNITYFLKQQYDLCELQFFIYEVKLQYLRVITLKMIGHYIENTIKLNGEISNKDITHFSK